ncbi:MAG: class I SAM-dependent methyltransferase, partial [Candidatus Aenigmarchaeota archaeon]|nr:class I SAM-dependent methyltransferase [Candidatus Aenigmarchaeota archaeon]
MTKMNSWEKFFVNSFLVRIPVKYIIVPRLLRLADKPLAGKAIEVGTGSGVCARSFASLYKHLQIAATDIDAEEVAFAKSIPHPNNVCFKVQDATRLNFKQQVFDYAFSFNTMHHVKGYRSAFSELYRVLKPNGLLLIQDIKPTLYHPRCLGP